MQKYKNNIKKLPLNNGNFIPLFNGNKFQKSVSSLHHHYAYFLFCAFAFSLIPATKSGFTVLPVAMAIST